MKTDIHRQSASFGPARPLITAERLDRGIAEGRRLQGLAMRRAFAHAGRWLGALPGRLTAGLRSRGAQDSCYRLAR